MAESSAGKFLELLRLLTRHEVDFIIVGGVAGVLAGAPLLTLDLDIVFDQTLENVKRLLTALREIHAKYRDPAGRHFVPDEQKLLTFRMNLFTTDLGEMDALATIGRGLDYGTLLKRSLRYQLTDLLVRAIDLPTLIEAKELADRPKDRYALLFLRETLELQRRSNTGGDAS